MAIKILLADDSLTIQKVVELTFSDAETRLMAVGSGDRAVQALDDFQPDIVLADVVMPGLTGYDVCDAVKQRPGGVFVPVVLLTGTFEPFDRARAERVGSDAIVTKPFDSHALQGLVRDLVARARAVREEAEAAAAAAPGSGPSGPSGPVPEPPPTMILSAEELEEEFPPRVPSAEDTGATQAMPALVLPESFPPPFAEEEPVLPVEDSNFRTMAMRIPTAEELAAAAPMEIVEPAPAFVAAAPPPPPAFYEPEPVSLAPPPPSPFYRPEAALPVPPPPPAFYEPEVAAVEPPPSPFDVRRPRGRAAVLRRRLSTSRNRRSYRRRPLLLPRSTSRNQPCSSPRFPLLLRPSTSRRWNLTSSRRLRSNPSPSRRPSPSSWRWKAPSRSRPQRLRRSLSRSFRNPRPHPARRRSRSRSTMWRRSRQRRGPGDAGGRGARVRPPGRGAGSCRSAEPTPGGRSGRRRRGVRRALPGDGRARPGGGDRSRPLGRRSCGRDPAASSRAVGGAGRHRGDRAHHPRSRRRPRGVRGVRTGAAPARDLGAARRSHRRGDPGRHRHARHRPGGARGPADGGPVFVRAGGHGCRCPHRRPLGADPVDPGPRDGRRLAAAPVRRDAGGGRSSRDDGTARKRGRLPRSPTPTSTGSPAGSSSSSPTRSSATSRGRSCRSTPSVSSANGSPRSSGPAEDGGRSVAKPRLDSADLCLPRPAPSSTSASTRSPSR